MIDLTPRGHGDRRQWGMRRTTSLCGGAAVAAVARRVPLLAEQAVAFRRNECFHLFAPRFTTRGKGWIGLVLGRETPTGMTRRVDDVRVVAGNVPHAAHSHPRAITKHCMLPDCEPFACCSPANDRQSLRPAPCRATWQPQL